MTDQAGFPRYERRTLPGGGTIEFLQTAWGPNHFYKFFKEMDDECRWWPRFWLTAMVLVALLVGIWLAVMR